MKIAEGMHKLDDFTLERDDATGEWYVYDKDNIEYGPFDKYLYAIQFINKRHQN